ncbi:vitamin B12 dependent-methionine synthase activation domain-containing protein [Alistipes indistinctus]|uniref:vitamin B12 dependent-methionine synthase activation domain-containing protein n=1 Tax=Alistipes indistinctus TaxID=626932 RepID=UPI00242EE79C|nr:vitamin B12 dependent-methionine synthase activation domain-containing protein [Alistipes indistinctus]
MESCSVPFAALGITPADVFEAMGYGQNRPDAETERLIARLIPSFESAEHLYCSRMFDGKTDKRTIEVGGQTFDTGTTVAAVMRGAERFAVFIATAGKDYEQRRDALKDEGDILSEYALDAIGSAIAVKMGEYVEAQLERKLGHVRFSHHLSPGHCNWPVADQQKLFHLMGENPCGVTLSDSFLMYPVKSLSGIIGIGERVRQIANNCDVCPMINCFKRHTSAGESQRTNLL